MSEERFEALFSRLLSRKRRGGVPLSVGVSRGVWMGGVQGDVGHESFVFVGPDGWEGEEELTFFSSREAVDALIERLRSAATEAWGENGSR